MKHVSLHCGHALCDFFECVYTLVEVYKASDWSVEFLGG